jgi:2-polyprenyl-3-methyl-5-hydroxy-6-metoxy-1,4-benzoquinol methylase
MPLLSDYAKKKKINYFLKNIDKQSKILEIGCGSQWLSDYIKSNGWKNYTGLDINPPADIVGDLKNWKELGLEKKSFDYIIAFEVVEHVDIFNECYALLNDNGLLMLTTPVPHMDWILKIFEKLGLNQQRTSPHDHLIYLDRLEKFSPVEFKKVAFLSQWGKFRKK